jgi:hypothetical protein
MPRNSYLATSRIRTPDLVNCTEKVNVSYHAEFASDSIADSMVRIASSFYVAWHGPTDTHMFVCRKINNRILTVSLNEKLNNFVSFDFFHSRWVSHKISGRDEPHCEKILPPHHARWCVRFDSLFSPLLLTTNFDLTAFHQFWHSCLTTQTELVSNIVLSIALLNVI